MPVSSSVGGGAEGVHEDHDSRREATSYGDIDEES